MKTKTETYYITRFVAEDGEIFSDQQECIEYEKTLYTDATIAADLVPHVIYSREWFDACAVDSDLVAIFYPRDLADTKAVCDWAAQHDIKVPDDLANDTKPILFDLHDYNYNTQEDENSLCGIQDVWGCFGSIDDMIARYTNNLQSMLLSGLKEAHSITHDNALSK